MIRTVNVLAHELGMLCVATSVDDPDVLSLLGQLGVDYAQGSVRSARPCRWLPSKRYAPG